MKYVRASLFIATLVALAACGGGGRNNASNERDNASASSSSSGSSSASSNSTSSSSSSSSSSGLSGAGFGPLITSEYIPNASASGVPYCRYSESSDGWGWENEASCIVYGAAADSGAGNFNYCVVGDSNLPLCTTDDASWSYADNQTCISRSLCPGYGPTMQTAIAENLSTSNAHPKAEAVYDYLRSVYGKKMLSGQQDTTWNESSNMFQRVFNDTGKYPAIAAYDFLNYGIPFTSGLSQTEEAINYWNDGGLVSFSWHWRDPATPGESAFYTWDTDFQIPISNGVLDQGSADFTAIVDDIDLIAAELKALEGEEVPVLWRPLHESSGGWFWWGRTRDDGFPAAYAQILLWRYMYDRLVNHHQLSNLIWVWNGQSEAWFPGDEYVDIVGHDVYTDARDYRSSYREFSDALTYGLQRKLIAMTENASIPSPDVMANTGVWWLYFLVWNDGLEEDLTHPDNFWTGEYHNTNEHKFYIYNHDLVITRDELPEF